MDPLVIRSDEAKEYYTEERCHILELSNSAADSELSIARARVEPGVTTAFHRVLQTAERYVIISGSGCVDIDGLDTTSVTPGDVVLIPPDVKQRISNTGDEDLVFLALCTPRFQPENYLHDEGCT